MKKGIQRVFLDGIYMFGLWILGFVNPKGRMVLMEKWVEAFKERPFYY